METNFTFIIFSKPKKIINHHYQKMIKFPSVKLILLAVCVAYLASVGSCKTDQKECVASTSSPPKFNPFPRIVCNPRCTGYFESGDTQGFIEDRCCTFIVCPYQTSYDKEGYAEFREDVCENSATAGAQ